jgi:maltokinase
VTQQLGRLTEPLRDWIEVQRWFAGKDQPVLAVRPVREVILHRGEPELLHAEVEVLGDNRAERYQMLISVRSEPDEYLSHALITELDGRWYYDAAHDPDATGLLLDLLVTGAEVDGIHFEPETGEPLKTGLRARPVTTEQSNTSLVFGQRYILKLFRRLSPGRNRDLDLHRALRDVGCEHIAEPLGAIRTQRLGEEPVVLAMLQRFLPAAAEGWAMAIASVRDLLAEGDLHAEEVGGDFAGEAHRLGQAVGAVHADLRTALGSSVVGPQRLDALVDEMHARLDAVLIAVPELSVYERAVREAFDRARPESANPRVPVQQVHGDLHLGQVLRTTDGWVLIDFEGEPAAPLGERSQPCTPLRDVASMIRSFDYAAHQLLVGQPAPHQSSVRAIEWAERNAGAFCDGYTEAVGEDPRDQVALLRAFELDKAVYEVGYEHANRPDWLPIPLASIARLTTDGALR